MNNEFVLDKKGASVTVRNNDMGKALRRLKKIVQGERIIQDYRKNEYFEKPSEAKKRKKAAAVKRWRKKESELKAIL